MDAVPLRQPKWLLPLAFFPPLILYLATTSPTLTYGGDCGELIAASYVLGNAHPTGYPLYLLLGKLFSFLPVGEVAFRYNLFSVLCAAGAVTALACAVFRLTRDAFAALVGAWSLACAYVFWTQAIIAEVYALSALLIALLILTVIIFIQTEDSRWLGAAAFTFGLGLTNHLPILFVGAPLGAYCVWTYARRGNIRRTRAYAQTLLLFLLPLTLYLYLPLRAQANPPMNWGNPATWSAFWAHVSGKLYQPHVFATPLVMLPHRLLALGGLMALQFLLTFPLGLLGGGRLLRQGWGMVLILGALLDVAVYISYDVLDLWNFFFPVYVTFGLCVGLGAAALREWARRFFTSLAGPAMVLITLSLLLFPALQVWAAYPRVNLRGNRRAYEDARALLAATAPNSTLFIKGDESLFGLWYLQNVEGMGNDRKIFYGQDLMREWQQGTLHRRIAAALQRGRVFLNFYDAHLARRYYLRPRGAACEVLPLSQQPPPRRIAMPTGKPVHRDRHGTLWSAALSQTTIKRGNLLTLTTRWQWHTTTVNGGNNKIQILFAHVGLGEDAPKENRELSSALAINRQFLSWRDERPLRGDASGVWEESFPLEIRDDSMIGTFRLFARLTRNGHASPWKQVGVLTIVDK
ncbi:MAG: DUF2723 domain-containing protein [Abditibacteriales bacterium]|nr:DUF2723 domain-containing protein [Abditibacteriales bacterium]MDW8365171.1 DUF2723 domain-containing protein [Abditibacteriales bacterium]